MTVSYKIEDDLSATEFIDVLRRLTLSERRTVDDRQRIEKMLEKASVIVCARITGQLNGVSRAITDFADCTYLSDLAVDARFRATNRTVSHVPPIAAATEIEPAHRSLSG